MLDFNIEQQQMPIGKSEIADALQTFNKYKAAKAAGDKRVIEAFDYYRLHQRDHMRKTTIEEIQPASAWLHNVIQNKHADIMDNKPAPNILPREENDVEEAALLSKIIPCVLDQIGFNSVLRSWAYDLIIGGTGVFGVFWDGTALNGLGDIAIKNIDVINMFWEPGITDLQKSANVFVVEAVDNDVLTSRYPQLRGKLSAVATQIAQYNKENVDDQSQKTAVFDWYYKRNVNGKDIVHYVKFCNDEVLYATENTPERAQRGIYDDGRYPFRILPCIPIKGDIMGAGFVDVVRDDQDYVDRLRQAILKNVLANTAPRYLIREGSTINEDEYLDYRKPAVHYSGANLDNSVVPITGAQLPSGAFNMLEQTIEQLKETSGTRDVSTGGTTSGVTAASAIAALQEASGKISRDLIDAIYEAYKDVIVMVIERIRQYYDTSRTFRILGEHGAYEFVKFTNAGMQLRWNGMIGDTDLGYRLPLFDIEITAEKQSPYKRISNNELALQLYSAGLFDPSRFDQSLITLDMMDFPRKEHIIQQVAANGQSYIELLAANMAAGNAMTGQGTPSDAPQSEAGTPKAVSEAEGEATHMRKARQQSADSSSPR